MYINKISRDLITIAKDVEKRDIYVSEPENSPYGSWLCKGYRQICKRTGRNVSTMATPTTDEAAIKSIELIAKYLPEAVAHGEDVKIRDMMAHAEYLAGIAFNNASLGYVHSMAHQLGGFYDLPHGVCNAILLPYVEAYNKQVVPERFADIAKAMGENIEGLSPEEAADKAIEAIKNLASKIGIPSGLRELGARKEDFKLLAENAMQDVCRLTNPRELSKEDIIEIYRRAM
ncbi:MAG: iron-containing alcohol dehydrogenase [Methanosarcina sp.]|nr:iron-containing alcohol dehydrogenase [Methanosarcina sp.]MDD4305350.1 iron-containing alcohol dehydrogenase [Methanosarcina sp.]MDD4619569.1 iron-containing alcohol dehydrogenase [Methanosarcina sp.]